MSSVYDPSALTNADSAEGPTLLRALNLTLRYRRLTLGLPLVLFALVAVTGLLARRTYTSNAAFMPQSAPSVQGALAGLAGQFGINIASSEPGQSPNFYIDLLRSPEILGRVVDARYSVPSDTGTVAGTLIELLEIEGPTPAVARELAIKALDERITANPGIKTGVVRFGVSTPWPTLSRDVAQRIWDEVNQFNLTGRRTRAGAERRFIEGRLQDARAELTNSEERLQRFLQRNREFAPSSELAFQRDRLERDVAMRQQVFTSLVQSYEQARIDEVRDTPMLTLVEHPTVAARPDPRGLVNRGLLTLFTGAALGMLLAMAYDSLRRHQEERSRDFVEFEALSDQVSSVVGRALRRSGRRQHATLGR